MKYVIYFLTFSSQMFLFLAGPPKVFNCLVWDPLCLTVKEQAISTFIATSVPELGKEKLDPVIIDFLPIDEKGLKFHIRNLCVQGLKNLVIDNVRVDASSRVVRIMFHTDFVMDMAYITNGTLLSMPFYGEGDYRLNLDSVLMDMAISFDVVKDAHGREYIDLKRYQYDFDVRSGAQFSLDNLYYGDKHLSDIMHKALHKNWKFITKIYAGYLFDKVNDEIFNSIRSYMFSKSLDTIFLY